MSLGRISLGLLLILGLTGMLVAEPKPTRPPVPTVKHVQNAFHTISDEARSSLLTKLIRAGADADTPEIIAAVIEGLQRRLDKQTVANNELHFIAWLGTCQQQEAIQRLRSYLSSKDLRVAVAASWAFTDNKRAVPWELILPLTKLDVYPKIFALRRTVVAAAELNASKEAIDFLIRTVGESDGQLKFEAVRSLAAVTGQTFGGHADKWAAWWTKSRENFGPVALKPASPPPRVPEKYSLQTKVEWDKPLPSFYDLPVYAKRVLFVIDCSGSMLMVEQGESRIDRARREMEKVILSLPGETQFGIIAFDDLVSAYSPTLVPANYENQVNAVVFAQKLQAVRHTNCYDALAMALEADPNLEAIYLLSDGAPNRGRIVDPPSIVEAITAQNQLHRTSFYTLGIDARGNHEIFLRQLAARNHGEFFAIR